MLVSLCWKNVWRSKVRSLVVIIAVTLGLFGGIFGTSVMNGVAKQKVESVINTEISHIQIHDPKYLENNDSEFIIQNPEQIVKSIKTIDAVEAVSMREEVIAMANTASKGSGVTLSGIDPESESKITDLKDKIVLGEYFKADKKNRVVLGKKLADKLKLKINSKVILTFQDHSGYITGGAFRVEGIFKTSNSVFDETTVYVKREDLSKITGYSDNRIHEIAIKLKGNELVDATVLKLENMFPNYSVRGWKKISPELGMLNDMTFQWMIMMVGIILLALTFGIINTMLMVVMERTREIGMLMAIGMSQRKIFFMITVETIMLSLVGGISGLFLSWLAIMYFSTGGINLSMFAEGFEALGYSTLIYPYMDSSQYLGILVLVICAAVAASIYPAWKALKLKPTEAIRTV